MTVSLDDICLLAGPRAFYLECCQYADRHICWTLCTQRLGLHSDLHILDSGEASMVYHS